MGPSPHSQPLATWTHRAGIRWLLAGARYIDQSVSRAEVGSAEDPEHGRKQRRCWLEVA